MGYYFDNNDLFQFLCQQTSDNQYDIDGLLDDIEIESEAERLSKLEKRISTDIVKADLLNSKLTIVLPIKLVKEIDKEIRNQKFIYECRKKPTGKLRFPKGCTAVRNFWRFEDALRTLYNKYLFEPINKETIDMIDLQIQILSDKFICNDQQFIDYI